MVLVALPQADGRLKNRPAVALRRLPGFGDWLLCGVSTQLRQEIAGFDDPIRPGHVDFGNSGNSLLNSVGVANGEISNCPRSPCPGYRPLGREKYLFIASDGELRRIDRAATQTSP